MGRHAAGYGRIHLHHTRAFVYARSDIYLAGTNHEVEGLNVKVQERVNRLVFDR